MKNQKLLWPILAIVAIVIGAISIIVLCFFEWQSPEVYSQGLAVVISAALGAILTAIITRMVISSQLQNEQEKEKNIKIYQMKLEVYSNFVSEMWKLLDDGKIDDKELSYLRSEVFNKLLFMLQNKDVKELKEIIDKLRLYVSEAETDDKERDNNNVIAAMGSITKILRNDIIDQQIPKEDEDKNALVNLWNAFSIYPLNDEENPTEKPKVEHAYAVPENKNRQYWHMNMSDPDAQRKALIDGKNELSIIEYEEEGKRTNLLKQVQGGDIIFVYNKGNMFLGIFEAIGRRLFYYEGDTLKEEFLETFNGQPKIIEDSTLVNNDVNKYDIYKGIEYNVYYCSNLIVKPLAVMLIPKDEDVVAYRPTICRYWKDYGDSILNKYKEALDSNNPDFGKIDGKIINCDTDTFKSLFK